MMTVLSLRHALPAAVAIALTAATTHAAPASIANVAQFSQLRYQSDDPQAQAPGPGQYENPILPGFYSDPSITRVGDTYYLINSTFAYFPGIPVFQSKDLVDWRQIGDAINRPDQLDFSGLGTSRGVFAPDISFKDGVFYIVNTCVDCRGNFLITATDPAGPWSDPIWLNIDGIDPSLFHDDDGKSYLVNNGSPEGTPLYEGHRAIWVQQFDLKTRTLVGPRNQIVNGGVDITKHPQWIEGPHILKRDGVYYLIAAEGGTGEDHSEVVFRATTPLGPYQPYSDNPILTQRDLDPNRPRPVTSSGHADLVQTAAGAWWAVFLATQPYAPGLYNTGRETFLAPVIWKDGWPIILKHGQSVPLIAPRPDLPGAALPGPPSNRLTRDGYGDKTQSLEWMGVRTPTTPFLKVIDPDHISLAALPQPIGDTRSHPSFIGLRQRHVDASFSARMAFQPRADGDEAGLMVLQNDAAYLFCGLAQRDGQTEVIAARRSAATDPRDGVILAAYPVDAVRAKALKLIVTVNGGKLGCQYAVTGSAAVSVLTDADATFLSTEKAGGFVGSLMGVYALSADFAANVSPSK